MDKQAAEGKQHTNPACEVGGRRCRLAAVPGTAVLPRPRGADLVACRPPTLLRQLVLAEVPRGEGRGGLGGGRTRRSAGRQPSPPRGASKPPHGIGLGCQKAATPAISRDADSVWN